MKKFYSLLIILLFAAGAFLRFYNFENRLIFGPEQGISLLTSAGNLTKFSLLGEYNLQRATSAGHNLIHGPLFSYFLLPFIVLFNFRVLPVSLVFPFLNLITALILFIISKKLFGKLVAALTLFFFLFSSLMIYHSLFIWIYHPLILLGTLSIWFIAGLSKNQTKVSSVFWLGLISGIGFSLQYPFLIYSAFLFFLVIFLSKKRLPAISLFLGGFFLANITRVIFDLRHDFYHLRTLWQFFLDVYFYRTISGATYSYHYLHLFPIFCLLLALVTGGLYKVRKVLALIPITIFLYLSFTSPLLDLKRSTGMPPGITLKSLEAAANTIADDLSVGPPAGGFNVATLWDFDTVARPMKYLLQYNHGLTPQGFENYGNLDALYVFAPEDRDINNPEVWEFNTFKPYRVTTLISPSAKYRLYKLTK